MLIKMLKQYRVWVLVVAALAVVGWFWHTDPAGGADTLLRLQWVVWLVVVAGPVYLIRRALMDGARSREAFREGMKTPTGAGLIFLGLCILTGMLFLAMAGQARGANLPPKASAEYLPVLAEELATHWPAAPLRSVFAAQVEQETCPSLTSKKCWSPGAELKTSREYGFGLGQLTVTKRFDNFAGARGLDPTLRDWAWADRYDARRQLRTMVLMDRAGYRSLKTVPDQMERLAMAFSAYNGGLGGVLNDRRLCGQVAGCDPARWFGHVELHSLKARAAVQGYGKSFYEINRGYVRAVMIERRPRYAAVFGEG